MSSCYRDRDGYLREVDTKRLTPSEQLRSLRDFVERVAAASCGAGHDLAARLALELVDSVEVTQ